MRLRRFLLVVLPLLGFSPVLAIAGERADIGNRIRQEERAHSQIMHTVHVLSDIYGPRLTGSPNEKAAAEWAIGQMTSWGMKNGHLEPWDFGHPGWGNDRASGYIVSPIHDQLTFKVAAWTPGTKGTMTAQAVTISPPEETAKKRLAQYLNALKASVKGKIVMVGKGSPAPADTMAPVFDGRSLARMLDPKQTGDELPDPKVLTARQWHRQIDTFLIAAGALMRVNDAHRQHGEIRTFANYTYDLAKALPTAMLRNEDYGRIARILADGIPVTLAFDIRNRTYPDGRTSYNAIAEIPGTDKADEVVMLGAHLDSWHLATGATDNAVGCAVMMEAARILLALGVHPRRTIRIALWSGEEEDLLGSQDYVARHFGTAENLKPEFSKLSAYINIDSGTGRIRAANVFGPPEDAKILRAALAPLSDLGVAGAVEHRTRRLRSTDATTFSRAGLPAIGLMQDPIEYGSITWHSNLDTYEEIIEDDVKQQAIVIATLLYELAMRDEMMPRFTANEMPTPVGPAPAVQKRAGGARIP